MTAISPRAAQVRARCPGCGHAFSQPDGAVTSCICQACRRLEAERCRAAGDTPEAIARLFRAAFEGIIER